MTEQKEKQGYGREGEIDPFYGQPMGSRRLEIKKIYSKLLEKKHALANNIHNKYKESFEAIKVDPELEIPNYIRELKQQEYFELLSLSQGEYNQLEESPLAQILKNDFFELCDRNDHENMLDATDSIFRNDSDPVLSSILDKSVYKLNVLGNIKRERKKARHRSEIYGRRLQKHVYEKYLSQVVGKPITIEQYEKEFGFLSSVSCSNIISL